MAVLQILKDYPNDEVTQFQMGRYVSSNEAFWRIFGFHIHDRYPNVVHLSVHLENGQRVYFTEANIHRIVQNPPNTTLTAFFELCGQDSFAATLLYSEVPKYYTWNASSKLFSRRKRGLPVPNVQNIFASNTLGRVYTVHPSNSECFYLRILLHHVRGPTSFTNLRTVSGEVCRTFRQACQKLGLLEMDTQWHEAMLEASASRMPRQLRPLFAIILTTCAPSDPQALWLTFRDEL